MSTVHIHDAVILKNTITDQAGNNIMATNAKWIPHSPFANRWMKQ